MPPHASINSARGYFDTSSAVVPTSAMRLPTTTTPPSFMKNSSPGTLVIRLPFPINKPENALNESLFAEKDLNSVFRKYDLNSTRNRPCVLH